MIEARFWHAAGDGSVTCDLCPHGCRITEGHDGRCRVRGVRNGALRALAYGLVSSAGLDPIEKKPLYHFLPGNDIYSVGGWGCNFACAFCQNWSISQEVGTGGRETEPSRAVAAARADRSVGIAYTYNEPLVGYEFVEDCARLARAEGLANVLVTNGYVRPQPAARLLPLVDALNVDIKSMAAAFYRDHCAGELAPVLAFAVQAREAGCHVEVTNLLIPGLNDGEDGLRELAEWIAANLGPATPLHLSAYFPRYRMDRPPTPPAALETAFRICAEKLRYVYLGNVRTKRGQDTLCPGCGAVLVQRCGYRTAVAEVTDGGSCGSCGRPADLVLRYSSSSSPDVSSTSASAGL